MRESGEVDGSGHGDVDGSDDVARRLALGVGTHNNLKNVPTVWYRNSTTQHAAMSGGNEHERAVAPGNTLALRV